MHPTQEPGGFHSRSDRSAVSAERSGARPATPKRARLSVGLLLALLTVSPIRAQSESDRLTLWYDEPAGAWTAALPVGNGRLGAMVFGGVPVERIQLNEESVWAGPPVPENPADMTGPLAEARRLCFEGDPAAGQQLVQEQIMAPRISPRSHQTLGDLRLRMLHKGRPLADPVIVTGWRRGPVRKMIEAAEVAAALDDDAWPAVSAAVDRAVPEQRAVVFRAAFELSAEQLDGKLTTLWLGPIDDTGNIFLNGERIGQTTRWDQPHEFDVRGRLRAGRNTLAIAVSNIGGPGQMAERVELRASNLPDAYRRELNLDTAIATTIYRLNGVTYGRQVFASPVDDCLIVRLTADQPGKVACDVTLERPVDFTTLPVGSNRLLMSGQVTQNGKHAGVRYAALLDVTTAGGSVSATDNTLEIRQANSATLLLAAATDYNRKQPDAPLRADLMMNCARTLAGATARPYGQLRADHVAEHQRLFRRVALELGDAEHTALPTDERLARVASGATDVDLEALYFQYGRYLLIGSSRPSTLPANLQGIWNEHIAAPWNADYHTNINLQMNYWPAEVCNLAECHEPLFDLIEGLVPAGRELARRFGCGGFTFGHTTDVWRWAALQGQCVWGMWPLGAGWCSAHFMEHYRFTGDRQFLRGRAYPVLREAAAFFLEWLVEHPATGRLVSGPTTSPENAYLLDGQRLCLSMGPAMDQQIIWETFTNTLEAAKILDVDPNDPFIKRVRTARDRLAPPRVGDDGRLMEWPRAFEEAEPGHRHMSHLYGLHPGYQFTPTRTPELAAAARKTLAARLGQGGGHTGWSRAWIANFYARLHDGEAAHEHVRALLAKSTLPNLFDTHPPFQIDGNFGGCAAIAEMLLQSHAGEIRLLPALPSAWPNGRVSGLRARGDITVDIAWRGGRLVSATLLPGADGTCTVSYGDEAHSYDLRAKQPITIKSTPSGEE